MAKKTLQVQRPENISFRGYTPVDELNHLTRKYELYVGVIDKHVQDVEIPELKAAIEAKKVEIKNTIKPIADEFNFPNVDRLIDAINRAYTVPDNHKRNKLIKQYRGERIETLVTCCKEIKKAIRQIGDIDTSLLSSSYDSEKIVRLLMSITVKANEVETVATDALANMPEQERLSKRIPYWWFVEVLADFWKAEIKEKPKCNYSIAINDGDGGYTGKFYKFVTACTELDRAKLGVGISNGSTIKNILKEWSITNPM